MASITVTADTADDPYSAFWANVAVPELQVIHDYLRSLDGWQLAPDPASAARSAQLLVDIEYGASSRAVFLAPSSEAVDAAGDHIERRLGRAPDSLS